MPTVLLRRKSIVPAAGPPAPPPVPTAITFNPASPALLDNAPVGTLVTNITVVMSSGLFTGTLVFASPFFNDGGIFAFSGSRILTNTVLPAGNSTQNLTVSATQNGVTISANLAISVQAHATSTGTGKTLTTLGLTSAIGGTALPSLWGVAFPKGATVGPVSTDVPESYCVTLRTWNDGSVKHVAVITRPDLSANVLKTVNIIDTPPVTGANLTSADIAANSSLSTAGQNVVSLGALGSVDLSTLLGSPVRAFVSCPQMVECHYKKAVANSGHSPLLVFFHVRLYKGGRIWVRAIVENGYQAGSATITLATAVTLGGAQTFNNASYVHYANTRFDQVAWIGGDPQITPKHDMSYLMATKLVPNYFADPVTSTVLSTWPIAYTPGSIGRYVADMSGAGSSEMIAPLPRWDVFPITNPGDPNAWQYMHHQARAINSYACVARSLTDDLFIKPSALPNATLNNAGTTNNTLSGAGNANKWENAHQPSVGYLAYLLTAEYYYFEDIAANVSINYLTRNGSSGNGTSLYFFGEVRTRGWIMRNVAQFCAIASTGDPMIADYQAIIRNMNNQDINGPSGNFINKAGFPPLGWIDPSTGNMGGWSTPGLNGGVNLPSTGLNGGAPGTQAQFMMAFVAGAYGFMSDIEPLADADMANLKTVRDFQYNYIIGKCGTGTSGVAPGWNIDYIDTVSLAGNANAGLGMEVVPSYTDDGDITHWFSSWKACWDDKTNGNAGTFTGKLQGGDTNKADGHVSNHVWTLAYAVDHSKSGALAAYQRLLAMSNYANGANSYRVADQPTTENTTGYGDNPQLGIRPRSYDGLAELLGTMVSGQAKLINATAGNGVFNNVVLSQKSNARLYFNKDGASGTDPFATDAVVGTFPPGGVGNGSTGGAWAFSGAGVDEVTGLIAFTGGGHQNGGESSWFTADPVAGAESVMANGGAVGAGSGLVWTLRVKTARYQLGADGKPAGSFQQNTDPTTLWALPNVDGIPQVIPLHTANKNIALTGKGKFITGGYAGFSPDANAKPGQACIFDSSKPNFNSANPNLTLVSDQTINPDTGQVRTWAGFDQIDTNGSTLPAISAYCDLDDSLYFLTSQHLGRWKTMSTGPVWDSPLATAGAATPALANYSDCIIIPDPVNGPSKRALFAIMDDPTLPSAQGKFILILDITGTRTVVNNTFSSMTGLNLSVNTRGLSWNSDQNFGVAWEGDGVLHKITPTNHADGSGWTYGPLFTITGDVPIYDSASQNFPRPKQKYVAKYKCYIAVSCSSASNTGLVWAIKA